MGEQHAEGDVVAARIRLAGRVGQKFGHDAGDRCVKFEEAALVEDHRHGRSGDDLGEGGKIKESGGHDRRIPTSRKSVETLRQAQGRLWGNHVCFVDEVAEGFQSHQLVRVSYGDGRCREGTVSDGLAQDRKGREKGFVLMVKREGESWQGAQGACARLEIFLSGL